MNIALIVFAGSGTRMNTSIPKQFIKVKNKELVIYTINKFVENKNIDEIILVTSKDFLDYTKELVTKYNLKKISKVVEGGATRQESVRLGLQSLNCDKNDIVLIHDGDRPMVSENIINQCIDYLKDYDACCPILNIDQRLPDISNSGRTRIVNDTEVDIQTPQTFKYGLITSKHNENTDKSFSDDVGLVENGVEVKFFEGDPLNFKVTQPKDLAFFEKLLK